MFLKVKGLKVTQFKVVIRRCIGQIDPLCNTGSSVENDVDRTY